MTPSARSEQGTSLAMLVVALAVVSLLILLSADNLRPAADRRGAESCAALLAAAMRAAAIEAVISGRSLALVFPRSGRDEPVRWVHDGDGDGVRRDDVDAGIDTGQAPFWLSREVDSCRIGRPSIPELIDLPPSATPLSASDPKVRFGTSRMAVFTTDATATAGSVFVTAGGGSVCAIVVNGATARTRLYCWDPNDRLWKAR
jgi:type II secretory pathway pseudopilin PulG